VQFTQFVAKNYSAVHENHRRPRVVITGMGAITPLGLNVAEFWQGLLEGRSGIGRITQFDPTGFACQIAGEVKGFDPTLFMDPKEARRMARCSQIALAAAAEAVSDSGLPLPFENPERVGVYFGTAIGGFERAFEEFQVLYTPRGANGISPFAGPASIANMTAFHITQRYHALGPNATIVTACATGTQAVGEGTEFIRRGSAEVILCGGSEAFIRDFGLGGFAAMRALPLNFNDRPEQASRPFDRDREGFVLSEGAGVLVLERLEHALARGAHIHAEVLGHASSSDAHHMAAPDPTAEGAMRAMRWALNDAGVTPDEVDYINAHGTSTPANDASETIAIKKLFGESAYNIPISSTKSMMGHPMGASGALEAIVCALTIQTGWIHPTINYETPDPVCDLDYVPNAARRAEVNVALSNSFGLGGQNACLVLGKYQPSNATDY